MLGCSLYLGAMIMGMDIFIGCGYGSHMGIDVATLDMSALHYSWLVFCYSCWKI
jgi:hypothetical protein